MLLKSNNILIFGFFDMSNTIFLLYSLFIYIYQFIPFLASSEYGSGR